MRRPPRVRTLSVADGKRLGIEEFPNFGPRGNVTGMRRLYYGDKALLVRCGSYVYNVTGQPDIYERAH